MSKKIFVGVTALILYVDDCKICDDIMIVIPSGSFAESYAKANNISYRNE